MPTGYTAGIIDGTIKTFKQYAQQCIRAFGAAIHMRDDSMDKPYEPQEESTYHRGALQVAEKEMVELSKMSDEKLVKEERKSIEVEIKRLQQVLQEKRDTRQKLENMLKEVENYEPPTEDHIGYKEFMSQQLVDTIKWDADTEYTENSIKEQEEKLNNLNATEIRKNRVWSIEYDIEYHTRKLEEERNRIKGANEWVEKALQSIK